MTTIYLADCGPQVHDPPRMANVRAAALTGFEQVARYTGLDPAALLRANGLGSAMTADPDRPLPIACVAAILEEAAILSNCAHFGLLMAESRSLASIGPISELLKHEARVGDVVLAIVRHQHLFGHAMYFSQERLGGALLVRVELAEVPRSRQGYELVIAYFCRCVAAVLGRRWSPESVHFTHSAPSDLAMHRRVFSCPVYFASDFNGFLCPRDLLQEENPASNRELAAHAERMLALLGPNVERLTVSESVRRSLRLLLPEGHSSIEDVAANMCVTPRTLQRRLVREGAGFGSLLNEVRRELAQRYLAASHGIAVVASLTGYDRASSFTRWFSQEFNTSPAEWRRRNASS